MHKLLGLFCEQTIANPDGIQEPWPASVSSQAIGQQLMDGFIVGYNPKWHTGKVCFYGYEDCAELGSLDPKHQVVTDCTGYVKGQINMDKYKPYVYPM